MAVLAVNGGEPVRRTGFSRWPEVDEEDRRSVDQVVGSGAWWMYAHSADEFAASGGGESQVEAVERAFGELHHARHAYATTSGSGSLEIACRAIGLGPGDEVITTPYTFVATSTCILNSYAVPVYVDIDPDSYNLNPALVEHAITERTRAIIPVHFGGVFADMDRLREIADRHHLRIIEDAAHSHGASLRDGRWAGTLGDIGIFSMQQSKLLTCGEGGIITTNDDELGELAWSLRHYGRTRTGKWYEHFRLGWHYRMTEMQGALLLSQLGKLMSQNERRRRNAGIVYDGLKSLPGIRPNPQLPGTGNDVYYLLIVKYDSDAWDGIPREKIVAALAAEGIPVTGGYNFPLYANPLFQDIDFDNLASPYREGRSEPIRDFREYSATCPVAERACKSEALWMAQQLLLGPETDARDIVDAFHKVYENRKELRAE